MSEAPKVDREEAVRLTDALTYSWNKLLKGVDIESTKGLLDFLEKADKFLWERQAVVRKRLGDALAEQTSYRWDLCQDQIDKASRRVEETRLRRIDYVEAGYDPLPEWEADDPDFWESLQLDAELLS